MSKQPRPSSHHAAIRGGPINRVQPTALLDSIAPTYKGDPACSYGDPKEWWSYDPDVRAKAVAVCEHCPMRGECAQLALDHREHAGVWAGLVLDGLDKRTIRTRLQQVAGSKETS